MEIYNYLRDYQVNAIKTILKYLRSTSRKDCLIKLPTGTGKTGIMAVAANLLKKNILIIVPNATLPYQTKEEMMNRFWDEINYCPDSLKKVIIINDNNECDFNLKDNYVAIVTIQSLTNIRANNITLYKYIKQNIDVIFYDEGHREPACQWSFISRDLCKKTILFTATPYRNDQHVFDIDEKYVYKYSMNQAIKEQYVKTPKFISIPNEIILNFTLLSKYLLENVKGKKTLIRLVGSERMKTLKNALGSNVRVACCHSDYKPSPGFYNEGKQLLKHNSEYDIIIHSDMLCEGVNIPSLNTLICIDCYKNSKTMIQQIGRVLRQSTDNNAYIYLPADKFKEITDQWKTYLLADECQDNYLYCNGKFLSKLVLTRSVDIHKEIRYQKQANIFVASKSCFEDFKESVKEKLFSLEKFYEFSNSDYISEDYKLWTLCYNRIEPSKHFANKYAYDSSFEYVSILEVERNKKYFYFYYNSRRFSLPSSLTSLKKMTPNQIYSLLPNNSKIKSISFSSTNNSNIGPRNHSIIGESLNSLPSTVEERMSFCKNTLGQFESEKNKTQRYLGVITAKISDKDTCTYNEYIQWCLELLDMICSNGKNSYFSRFAQVTTQPIEPATSILIDLNFTILYGSKPVIIDSQYCVVENNKFVMDFNDKSVNGEIVMDANGTIQILLSGLDDYYCDNGLSLAEYLKQNNFFVYFSEVQVIYNNGIYFSPNITFHYDNANDCEMFNHIFVVKNLGLCVNEKLGANPNAAFNKSISWPCDSVFGVLIDEINNNHTTIDYLICDDLGCEIADFIAIDSVEKKIIFIHCKHKDANLSASAFQDLCGQAVKNIEYILTTDPHQEAYMKSHLDRWEAEWKIKNDKNEFTSQRCIKGTVLDFYNKYRELMKSPFAKKEVWLFTSGLSKKKIEKEITNKDYAEQYVQLMYILCLTQDNISRSGANMKIFCKE